MATSWNKKERENKKKQERKQKEEKKQERKESAAKGKGLDEMMAYLDENGNLTSVPPDPTRRVEIRAEDIEIGIPKQEDREPEDPVRKGVLTYFNDQKGFGFIEDAITGQRVFVHQSSANIQLKEGLRVSFEVEKGPKGLTAVNVSADKA
ncbi:MAG: cold shock domain-containing protein [Agriterribacter sp.]